MFVLLSFMLGYRYAIYMVQEKKSVALVGTYTAKL